MTSKHWNTDGSLYGFFDKFGQLCLLSFFWFLASLPLITIGSATTALYYSVMKSVRRSNGYPVKEFLRSYKANLGRGCAATAILVLVGVLLCLNIMLQIASEQLSLMLLGGYVLLLIMLVSTAMYLFPVFSRFSVKFGMAWKLAFVMAIRFLPITILLVGGLLIVICLQIFVFPISMAFLMPGIWCFLTTFLMEKALLAYMPAKEAEDDIWYYE